MRKIIIILIVVVFAFLCVNVFKYFQKTTSIKGVVYIEIDGDKVRPVKDMTIYLIKGAIKYELEDIREDYRNNVAPVEEEIKILKVSMNEKAEMADRDFLMLKKMEAFNTRGRTYSELKKKYEIKKKDRDETYRKYINMLEDFASKRQEYNNLFGKLLDDNFMVLTKTNDRGRYRFDNILKGNYFLYAIEGNFIGSNVWFVEVEVDKNISINLSKRNISNMFD